MDDLMRNAIILILVVTWISACDTQSEPADLDEICIMGMKNGDPCFDPSGIGGGFTYSGLASLSLAWPTAPDSVRVTGVFGLVWAGCPKAEGHEIAADRPYTCVAWSDTLDLRIAAWQCLGYRTSEIVETPSGRAWTEVDHPLVLHKVVRGISDSLWMQKAEYALPCEGGEVEVGRSPMNDG